MWKYWKKQQKSHETPETKEDNIEPIKKIAQLLKLGGKQKRDNETKCQATKIGSEVKDPDSLSTCPHTVPWACTSP